LKETEGTDPVRPVAVLNATENFSLQHGDQSEEAEKDAEKSGDVKKAGDELENPIGRSRKKGEQELLCADENLIEKPAAHLN
jgi:hypothetical protein